jgi:hypothetical protein
MLFKQPDLTRIRAGAITMAFRRWRRPTVAEGGTLRTSVGILAIDSVDRIRAEDITEADAEHAGYPAVLGWRKRPSK